jgi:hypothetical protein
MSQATVRPEPNTLHHRLAALRRRLRLIILWRGTGWLLSVVLLAAALAGLLDWTIHLPGLVRAVLLVGTLTGGILVAYRYLVRPLAAKTDDLTLALRVEAHYPILNDSLASTVEFLEQPDDSEQLGSPSLRREAVRRALRRVRKCDFNRVIDRRGVRMAGLSMMGACALAVGLILLNPRVAGTAMLRLTNPFGGPEWPRQTQLDIDPPRQQIGRNEAFDIHAIVRGVIPDRAKVMFQLDGLPQIEQVCDVTRAEGADFGEVRIRLEPGRVQRNFTFQVRANDAVSERYAVRVLPPPLLVPLHGRASPQVHLDYPHYTDLPATDLPDGSGNVEAVAGTVITLRAAADRPLARAWIEFLPEPRTISLAAFVGPLGARLPAEAVALTAAGEAVWGQVPAQLDDDRRELSVRFLPRVSGLYGLHFEDDIGLPNSRTFELRVLPDPAPVVTLERPTPSRDSLSLLPEAEFTLQVTAEDIMFAVRSVSLEYRCDKGDPVRRLSLYDQQAAGMATSGAITALAGGVLPLQPVRMRQQHVQVSRRVALKEFRHPGIGSLPLKEGDVLTLQAVADDFDDVSVDKPPGRSHEVEIQIISRNALDIALNKEQARIQQDLVRLREEQRDALKKVTEAEPNWKRLGKLTPEQLDELQQAEQIQEQIRERVGPTQQEGLRSEVARLLDTLKDNNLPRSAVHERMEAVQAELDRLAREELDQVQPRLTNVRKENDSPGQKDQKLLTEARKHQEEVEKTLLDLLSRLEPWATTQEIKGEAKSILQEERKLNQETEAKQQDKSFGTKLEELTAPQRAELERLQEEQQKLEQRTNELLDKMDRVSQERTKDRDLETARELQNARKVGTDSNVAGTMQDARTNLENNNLGAASKAQKESVKKLEELVKELEDRREAELDRLARKLRDAEQRMEELSKEQEELQKKSKEAGGISDPKQREEELRKLARRQQELQNKAKEMADELKRLRAERASQALGKASGEMGNAQEQLNQGGAAEEKQDDALDRLDEARRELKRALGDTEEELAREQLAKVADLLKHLKERQEALIAEAGRIQKEVLEHKGWDRGHKLSLSSLERNQRALGEETGKVAEEKLADALVFARLLRKAAKAMDAAAGHVGERYQHVSENPQDTEADEETTRLQQEALRRLNQLLEAIKPDAGVPQRAANAGGDEPGAQAGKPAGNPDGIPPLAQLKLLRTMQAEINQRTEEFTRQHPDLARLSEKDKTELQSIRHDQQEVADLLEELTRPEGEPQGDKP